MDELSNPIHDILTRSNWLKSTKLTCPKCYKPMRLVGIRILPKWICDKCNNVMRYEPIKIIKENVK